MKIFELDVPARKPDDPDVAGYDEIRKKKKDPNSEIDAVVAHLKGKRSEFFTKLARRFGRATRIKKMLAAEEKSLKKETLAAVDELFDATDEVYTRIIETVSLVFKISKASEKTVQQLDQAGYLAELEQLTGLAVNELEELKSKYITKKITKVLPRVLAPKEKTPESINEGAYDKIKQMASLVADKIYAFLGDWDQQFNSLKSDIEKYL
ncbi:MAG: hypothetical protein DRI24_23490 [Deltaproteobacteria bacterium]|nr:MAG: hypothetical protein DRI24_23490 [Deltaproteobacteria bacterium]